MELWSFLIQSISQVTSTSIGTKLETDLVFSNYLLMNMGFVTRCISVHISIFRHQLPLSKWHTSTMIVARFDSLPTLMRSLLSPNPILLISQNRKSSSLVLTIVNPFPSKMVMQVSSGSLVSDILNLTATFLQTTVMAMSASYYLTTD